MSRKMYFTTSIILGCMFVSMAGAIQNNKKELGNYTPKFNRKLFGKSYHPKKIKIQPDLSDWDLCYEFNSGDIKIKSIRLYGFDRYNSNNPIDFITKDSIVLETVSGGIGTGIRPPVSDISDASGGAGGGAYLGVLELRTDKNKNIIIGISQVSFFLGVMHGSSRQSFYSWSLAKQVDELVHKKTGKHFKKEHFEGMSGESWLAANKLVYKNARKKKEKDGKNQKK